MASKIEPSGVVMVGRCSVRTEKCSAREEPGALTAVWGPLPARRQIDVCGACLRNMVERSEWVVMNSPFGDRGLDEEKK